ncbi:arylsulfatase [Altererythrobacter sp. ZODW24]|uniref:arylsulfatase n=1 Tax=Altererythrobacter sp. ZODW24 TaxID=2185142 RepID=UPI000DF85985|nr:arylsulfatase [Altererythrobacter sp. ZODW24]
MSVINARLFRILSLLAFTGLLSACGQTSSKAVQAVEAPAAQQSANRPNILLIVADDLGFSDLGIMGGEIATPNLDKLASDGLLMTNFYAGGTCSPTRAMLLSGIDHHRAGVGTMMEHIAPNQRGQPGYEGYLNDRVVTLPELLQDAGYRTYAAGKWHLGMTEETSPATRGFDRSFMLLNGGASHFDQSGLNSRTDPAPYREDGVMVDLPEDFTYSTDFYTDRMIDYIEGGRSEGAPFFAYLAYTAPHWPLQAPAENTAKYAGVYDAGWQAIQAQRRERLVASGMMPSSTEVHPIFTDKPAWSALSHEEQRYEARKMEIYAGMVDRLDEQIGELIAYLKRTGQYENTVIVFMSDNGAEGAPLYRLDGFKAWMDSFDNSFANMGNKGSYVFYEERWAQVSMTPFRLYKGMASDGGTHVPAFITYGATKAQKARHTSVTSVMDIAPTLLELAGVNQPEGQYEGRDVLAMQGQSWVPVLEGRVAQVRTASEGLGSELFNKKAYRRGNWKALHLHEPFGPGRWQLYDLSSDPGETKDLAADRPELLAELVSSWNNYAAANGVVIGNTPPER